MAVSGAVRDTKALLYSGTRYWPMNKDEWIASWKKKQKIKWCRAKVDENSFSIVAVGRYTMTEKL